MSKIKIKRSTSASAPTGLEFGELAYSTAETAGGATQVNNGGRLFFKYEEAGPAAIIGGKYFTDMLDHAHGTLTADSGIITDSNNKIDVINVGNITITGSSNTISSTDVGGDIKLDTDTTGVVWVNDYYLPNNRGTSTNYNGFVLTMEDATIGKTSWKAPSTTIELTADIVDGGAPAGNIKIDLLTEILKIAGDSTQGIDTKINKTTTDNTVTITAKDATSSQRGVAKFDTSGFVVNTTSDKGNVTLKADVPQSFAGDSGTGTPTSNSFSIVGDSVTSGIVTTGSGAQVKISANYASDTQYGVAKFTADYWSNSSGVITIDNATNTDKGIAYFPATQFTVDSGSVSVKNATLDNAGTPVRGVSLYYNGNFNIDSDLVKTKVITLGTTELNNGAAAVTSVVGLTEIKVGDLKFTDNKVEIVSTAANPDLILLPYIPNSGTAGQVKIANSWVLPNTAGSVAGYVLTTNGSNSASWAAAVSTLNYKVDSGSSNAFNILEGILSVIGEGAINIATAATGGGANAADKTITVSIDKASTSVLGVASFSSDNFAVSGGGEVTIKDGGVANAELVNSKVTVGTTEISLGSSSTVLAGLTDVTIGKIQIKDVSSVGRITTTDGALELNAFTSVKIQSVYTLPNTAGYGVTAQGTANSANYGGQALVSDGAGGSDWEDIPYILNVSDDDDDFVVELLQKSLTIKGDGDQSVSVVGTDVSGNITLEVSVANATSSTVGVARFKSGDFIVGATNAGEVELDGTVVQSVASDSGTVTPTSNSFDIKGYTGANANNNAVTTSGSGAVLTITARLASDEVTGVARFNATNFTVDANGAVTSDQFTIGTTNLNLGGSTTVLAGLTDVTIGNIQIHDTNKIEYTTSDNEIHTGDIVLKPYTDTAFFNANSLPIVPGVVDVSSSRITNVASPINGTDAVNKSYTDSLVSGLDIKNSVRAATNAALTATYANGPGTLTNSGTQVALSGGLIDGATLALGDRVLVKNQGITVNGAGAKTAGADSVQNGIYTVTTLGSGSVNWVLTRADDANNTPAGEVTGGMFTFVEEGDTWADSGFILVAADGAVTLGTTYLTFTQFSAAGQTMAGLGLSKVGDTLNVEVNDTTGGIEITADKIQLKSAVGGDGLTYIDGVLAVGGTLDRITVSSNAIDIASTYVGQATITTLGTITLGTWQGNTIMEGYGGTGQSTYGKGDILYANTASSNTLAKLSGVAATSYQFLMMGSNGLPAWADIDGGTY